MLLGLLSDTHDRVAPTEAALAIFQGMGIRQVIHCGDVGGSNILDLLVGFSATFVWGNTDYDRSGLAAYAKIIGLACAGEMADLTIAGKRIAVTHGDNHALVRRIMSGGDYDYLLHGHTHVRRDERQGRLRIINPGALHRVSVKTVAVLDVEKDEVKFVEVE